MASLSQSRFAQAAIALLDILDQRDKDGFTKIFWVDTKTLRQITADLTDENIRTSLQAYSMYLEGLGVVAEPSVKDSAQSLTDIHTHLVTMHDNVPQGNVLDDEIFIDRLKLIQNLKTKMSRIVEMRDAIREYLG